MAQLTHHEMFLRLFQMTEETIYTHIYIHIYIYIYIHIHIYIDICRARSHRCQADHHQRLASALRLDRSTPTGRDSILSGSLGCLGSWGNQEP